MMAVLCSALQLRNSANFCSISSRGSHQLQPGQQEQHQVLSCL